MNNRKEWKEVNAYKNDITKNYHEHWEGVDLNMILLFIACLLYFVPFITVEPEMASPPRTLDIPSEPRNKACWMKTLKRGME